MENKDKIQGNEEEKQEATGESQEPIEETEVQEVKEPEGEPQPEPEIETETEPVTEPEPGPAAEEELEPVGDETPEEEVTEEEVLPPPEKEEIERKPSFIKRALHFLFSPETRVGRFMRPFLRTLALMVGMFAAGLLVAYFTLYTPLIEQRDQITLQAQQLNQDLQDANAALDDRQTELDNLQAISSQTIDTLEQELDLANFRIYFLIAKNDTLRARLALLDDGESPGGPAALAALNELDEHLQDLVPFVEEVDPVLATLLQDRLKVVKGELVRDGEQAKIELESFYLDLLDLEDMLFE